MTRSERDSDVSLAGRVAAALSQAPDVDASAVRVSVTGAILTLSGVVATEGQRTAAKGTALRVRGVKAISDKMVVRPAGAAPDRAG